MINTKYSANQCSNQDFEIREDEYPKVTYNKRSDIDIDIDIGSYTIDSTKIFLTNNYYAIVERGSDVYFKRMIYKIDITNINELECNRTEAKITVTGLDDKYYFLF